MRQVSAFVRFSAIAAAVLMLLALVPNAGVVRTCAQAAATSNGIIAPAPIIGIGTAGVTSVVGLTIVIMLTIVLVMAGLYMIGQVIGQPEPPELREGRARRDGRYGRHHSAILRRILRLRLAAAGPPPSANVTNPTLYFYGPGRSVFVTTASW